MPENREMGTLFLVSLAVATLALMRGAATVSVSGVVLQAAVGLLVPWGVWLALRGSGTGAARVDRWQPLLVAVWAMLPWLSDLALRRVGLGEAFEIVLLSCSANAALMLAAFAHRRRSQQVACLLSGFIVLFAVVIATSPAALVSAGLYGATSLWWMMARYWEKVQRAKTAAAIESCTPVRWSVIVATLATVLLVGAMVGATGRTTYVLDGFMPSSGGSRSTDEFARAGVGDGDALVAGKDRALSFGPVESELFLDSDMPSLYDMFNDMYGDPPKPKTESSIALSSPDVRDSPQQMAQSQQSGREFSSLRRRTNVPRGPLPDRKAPALMYVVGRVPLHLGLHTYDTFDGTLWRQSTHSQRPTPIRLEQENGKPWMWLKRVGTSPLHRGTNGHALKIINLKTRRIPSPPQLAAVHVDKVDRETFFGWTEDGVVEMPDRGHIPQLTVLHTRSLGLNLESLRLEDFSARLPRARLVSVQDKAALDVLAHDVVRHLRTPDLNEQVVATAHLWTESVSRGWRQVEAVVERLRADFQLDPGEPAPPDCSDVVSHFLRRGRGPDYLFATTSAVMLRTLGYPTRLVTGFYARPERFDRRAGQTSVLKQDVHVWAEVCVDGWTWVAIEPTPGYLPPVEMLTWRQRAAMLANALALWCSHHRTSIALAGALAIALWMSRIVWCEATLLAVCWLAGFGGLPRRVHWTLRLLECRARLAGNPRPATKTVTAWYAQVGRCLPAEAALELRSFLSLVEQTLYGSYRHSLDETGHRRACATVVGKVDVRRLRQLRA